LTTGSLESEKIISGCLESEKIISGCLESDKSGPWNQRNRIFTCQYWVPNIFLKKKLRNVMVYLVKAVKLLIVALHGISEMIVMNRGGYCLYCMYLL